MFRKRNVTSLMGQCVTHNNEGIIQIHFINIYFGQHNYIIKA